MKTPLTVLTEATLIGGILALMVYAGLRLAPRGTVWTVLVAFVCGALFHIGCQLTGLNDWYARAHFE